MRKKRRMARPKASGADIGIEDQRRRQLVAAVVSCVAENGFESTTMRGIAERAGVSTGMLNYYFRNKKELVVEAIRFANEGIVHSLAPVDVLPFGPKRLEYILQRTLRNEYPQALPLAFRLAVMAAAANDPELRREIVGWLEDGRLKFEKSIRAGIESGQYRPDLDPKLLSLVLYGAMTGLAVETAVSPDLLSVDQVVASCMLLLRLFESKPGAPSLAARGEKPSGAAIIGNLEQQLLADSALTPVKAVALTAAFRAMYQSMAVTKADTTARRSSK
jgi:TetR/AcrR family transcriptional regulator, transcriptional repressor of bet genes